MSVMRMVRRMDAGAVMAQRARADRAKTDNGRHAVRQARGRRARDLLASSAAVPSSTGEALIFVEQDEEPGRASRHAITPQDRAARSVQRPGCLRL